jgi:putative hydrolase of the HAD superfamily
MRALLMDAMGTLVHLEAPSPRLCSILAERLGVAVSETQAEQALSAEIRFYRAHMHEGRDEASLHRLRTGCAEVLREALPPTPALQAVTGEQLAEILMASLRFGVFEEVPEVLERLRDRGVARIVVSNWDASLPLILDRVGLTPWLDGVVTSAAVGAAKPEPAIFRAALSRLGVRAGEAVHVGDSLAEDVVGARAAGLRAVLLDRRRAGGPAGVRTVTSLRELVVEGSGELGSDP